MRACLILAVLLPSLAWGWGFDGHRKLSSLMQDGMPANHCLRIWLKARQSTALQDSSCDPDRNRICPGTTCDPLEAPRHYLEIDWVNPPANYPRDYVTVQNQLGVLNASRNGQVPWRVRDQYAALVAAFASKNETQILDAVFFFSHYVMDSFSVLHNTRNYDPNGLHSRWESDMLQSTANMNGVVSLALTYYGTAGRADPLNNIFDVVLVGNATAPALIAADVATSSGPDAGIHDLPAFYLAVRDLTARRWGDAVTLMSSLIWSAWAQAGSPALTGFPGTCSSLAPSSEIVLKGYPVPGGFTHPGSNDGGFVVPDAGAGGGAGGGTGGTGGGAAGGAGGGSAGGAAGGAAGGTAGGAAGGSGGGTAGGGDGSAVGGGGEEGRPNGCSCGSPGGLLLGALALLLARVRRR